MYIYIHIYIYVFIYTFMCEFVRRETSSYHFACTQNCTLLATSKSGFYQGVMKNTYISRLLLVTYRVKDLFT